MPKKLSGGVFKGPKPTADTQVEIYGTKKKLKDLTREELDAYAFTLLERDNSTYYDDITTPIDKTDTSSYVTFARGKTVGILNASSIKAMRGHAGPDAVIQDPITRQPLHPDILKEPDVLMNQFVVSPIKELVAMALSDGIVEIFYISSRRTYARLNGLTAPTPVTSLAFSPDGYKLASGYKDGTVCIWDMSNKTLLHRFQASLAAVLCIAFGHGLIATGGEDKIVRTWNAATYQPVGQMPWHTNWITALAFHPSKPLLASASVDTTIRVLDTQNRATVALLKGHNLSIETMAFSPDGSKLLSGSADNTVRMWDIESKTVIAVLTHHTKKVSSVAFDLSGTFFLSGSWDNQTIVWGTATLQPIANFHESGAIPIVTVAFTTAREDTYVLTGFQDKRVILRGMQYILPYTQRGGKTKKKGTTRKLTSRAS
jgi:WD40 repeat protein